MTIREVLTKISGLSKHQFSDETLTDWLSTLDGNIKTEILNLYDDTENEEFKPYDLSSDIDKELLVAFPYDEMYIYYLLRQINTFSDELTRANNQNELFKKALQNFKTQYIKEHKPLKRAGFKF